ncbi:MFS transporter [Methylocella tundrae]|uniref:Major facilitator superfamily MFS_1 n=1 Tax=Methylocella tundrae TaxID=227605 RepID=A0A4U8YV20_METTU|nr:MFS transporter [Methylocella tundrae]WPP04891.1 MFS transporter [Methylocella tundrae]VFU07151.1 Major facilitator superfamily MFS_1 [Methylocella tundrae]
MKAPTSAASPRAAIATLAGLMRSRRFAPLFWCQFFSAFNDNFVRNMLAMLILFRLGEQGAGVLVTLAVGVFVLPSLLLSGLGGEMADAQDKGRLARVLKAAEIGVQLVAAAGLWLASLPLLYTALFGLGVIAALFGPLKYAILPDLLKTGELIAANALVEAATFAAILLGLIAGGLSAARSSESVTLQLLLIALACWGFSLFIPATSRAAPGLRITPNILVSTGALLREVRRERQLWSRSIAVSWFWMTGAVALSLTPVVIRDRTGGGIGVETAVSALFAIGIGIGSMAAALIAKGRLLLRPVLFAAIGMGLFLVDLGVSTSRLPTARATIGLEAFFTSAAGLRVSFDVAGLACAGGLFVVPLFTAIQADAPAPWRSRIVAGVNVLNSSLIVAGVAATAALQSRAVGLSEPFLLGGLGVLTLAFAVYVRRCVAPAA